MIMPATLSIILDVFPGRERAKAIGIWSAVAGIDVQLAMVIGGYLLEQYWWRSVFLINIPIGVAILAAGFVLVPDPRDSRPASSISGPPSCPRPPCQLFCALS